MDRRLVWESRALGWSSERSFSSVPVCNALFKLACLILSVSCVSQQINQSIPSSRMNWSIGMQNPNETSLKLQSDWRRTSLQINKDRQCKIEPDTSGGPTSPLKRYPLGDTIQNIHLHHTSIDSPSAKISCQEGQQSLVCARQTTTIRQRKRDFSSELCWRCDLAVCNWNDLQGKRCVACFHNNNR